jgi:hypothetical protein
VAKRGGFASTVFWALCLVLLSLVAAIGLARYGDRIPVIDSILEPQTSETVVAGVRQLNELATAEMTAQVVVSKEQNARVFLQPLPEFLTGERVFLVARGEVEAGIDLDELDAGDVRVDGERVTIDLPETRILESSLDDETTKVYDWDRGLFVRGDYSLIEDARTEAKEQMEEAAREEDLVQKAQTNAEDSIGSFVRSLGFEEVVFT